MGIAGPGVQPDTATVPGVESPHSSGASPSLPSGASNMSAGADVPSSAAVSEPVGSQPDGTSVGVEFIFFLQTSSIVFLSRAPYPKEIRFFVCSFLAENFHFSLGFLPPPSSSDLDSWIGDFKPLDLDLQCLRVDLVPGGAVLVHSIVRRRSPRHPLPRLHFSGWNFPRVAFLLTPTPDVVGRFSLPLLLGRLLAHFLGSTGIVQMTLAVRYRKEGAIACANLSQMPPSPLILLPLRF
ncbi:uncharacterized protein LOC109838992 [Asparagus officinalis]|uniref:uncharacterized protein LOC109828383 n=1 Tax=Asparagus officinalis TaxID=4686 RepID=UPI00098DE44F|nr:uncharacterized protein LOC109828383 [Asparagus officinalis]XP_020263010.1 uncharacterized protein LOC109838992 [Asparagus officinalis]